jgi:hypothetical protein
VRSGRICRDDVALSQPADGGAGIGGGPGSPPRIRLKSRAENCRWHGRMSDTRRRLILYGCATAVLGGLAAIGFAAPGEADAMTLLGSADVQLRLAYAMPAQEKDGKPFGSRADLIAAAVDNLVRAERMGAAPACTAEMRGFAASLQGDFSGAADWYARAQASADVEPEQKDVLAFNQARMRA